MEFGLHRDVPAARYHADDLADVPSLSSSIAKVILNQTPRHAWIGHPRLNPHFEAGDEAKFDLGSVVHEMVLGRGGGFQVIDAGDYRTKDAKEARARIVSEGRTPILSHQHDEAVAITGAVLKRLAQIGVTINPSNSEVVGLWQDRGGPVCRMMIDNLDGPIVYDAKVTSVGLDSGALSRLIGNMGYDLSAGFYLRGLDALRPQFAGRWRFRWIFIEADEPHEVRVLEADRTTLEIGDRKAATAIAKWGRCMKSGEWPGYPANVEAIGLTDWAVSSWIGREESDEDCRGAAFSSMSRPVERAPLKSVYGAG